jgi:hypothetical protein
MKGSPTDVLQRKPRRRCFHCQKRLWMIYEQRKSYVINEESEA